MWSRDVSVISVLGDLVVLKCKTDAIRSILEDSSILSFFFRFSLLMLCICCKVRDLHMSRCVRITKHKQQQRSCILVQTRTQHKKRVPIVAEEMSQVLFSIVTGIK